jgi:hypothetical protein
MCLDLDEFLLFFHDQKNLYTRNLGERIETLPWKVLPWSGAGHVKQIAG